MPDVLIHVWRIEMKFLTTWGGGGGGGGAPTGKKRGAESHNDFMRDLLDNASDFGMIFNHAQSSQIT